MLVLIKNLMSKIQALKNGTRKEAIAKKAAELFKQKGFSATTMRDIGEALGVEAPSLYNHIASKKEILQEICFKVADLFTTNIEKVELSKKPVLEKLDNIIRFQIGMRLNEYQSVYISEHEWKHLPEPALSDFRHRRKSYRERLAGIFKDGIARGELNLINPDVAVLTLLSAINGIEYWHRSNTIANAGMLEENIVKLLLYGIKR